MPDETEVEGVEEQLEPEVATEPVPDDVPEETATAEASEEVEAESVPDDVPISQHDAAKAAYNTSAAACARKKSDLKRGV